MLGVGGGRGESGGYVSMGTTSGGDTTAAGNEGSAGPGEEPKKSDMMLYIQMAYCQQKTLRDFLGDPKQRMDQSGSAVDLNVALGLFAQVAKGVTHVHSKDLIHRDLKPSNCFLDNGVVKIGDFGLSRSAMDSSPRGSDADGGEEGQTKGVGTYVYASPEQMDSRDYGSSTDVYSLGVMLFELCFIMTTGMERATTMSNVKRNIFPEAWKDWVKATGNDAIDKLIKECVSHRPSERPSSQEVWERVEGILGKISVLSLDRSKSRGDGAVLLRVEAQEEDGILGQTVEMIKSAAPEAKILQYGLRGGGDIAIMEFALGCPEMEAGGSGEGNSLARILEALNDSDAIGVVRQVSDKHESFDE